MTSSVWIPLLAAALVIGGLASLARAALANRRLLAQRVSQVAPAAPTAPRQERARQSFLIADTRAGSRRAADLLTLGRACRRFGVVPRDLERTLSYVRAGAALGFAGLVFLVLQLSAKGGAPVIALGAGLLGWMAPIFVLRRLAAERKRIVTRGFADALELLVVCAEAGLALEDAVARVTKELQVSHPALAEELAMTSADLQVLPDRNQAFVGLAERVGSPAVRHVVSTLSQTLRYGTPLAGALRVAASELRSDSIIELEERAGRLPALMSIPMMLFILPTIMLIVSGPAILRVLDIINQGG